MKLPSTFLIIFNNRWKWVDHSVNPGELITKIGTRGRGFWSGEGVGRGSGSTQGSSAIHLLTGIAGR